MNILYSTEIRYIVSWSRKNEEGENKQTKHIKSHSHFVICTHAAGEIALVVEGRGSAIWRKYEINSSMFHFLLGAIFLEWLETSNRSDGNWSYSHLWGTSTVKKKKQKHSNNIKHRPGGKGIFKTCSQKLPNSSIFHYQSLTQQVKRRRTANNHG